MKELYYIALSDSNYYHWVIFLSFPQYATIDKTGFLAIGQGFDDKEEAQEQINMLNYSMFRVEPA